MKVPFSPEQLIHAEGILESAGTRSGLAFEKEDEPKRFPTYQEIQHIKYTMQQGVVDVPETPYEELPISLPKLQPYDGATVMVGLKVRGREAYFPGKVLPSGHVGALATKAALRAQRSQLGAPLEAIEPPLLTKFYLEQGANVDHEEGEINVATIGLGVVLASARDPRGLHSVVHSFEGRSELTGSVNLPTKLLTTRTPTIRRNGCQSNRRVRCLFLEVCS